MVQLGNWVRQAFAFGIKLPAPSGSSPIIINDELRKQFKDDGDFDHDEEKRRR